MAQATSIQQMFDAMPSHFQADKAGDLRAVVQFDLGGEGGGQYAVTIADGVCAVASGVAPNPTMTLSGAAADYLGIVNGDVNAMQAFMQGKIKIKGDLSIAMKMMSLFNT